MASLTIRLTVDPVTGRKNITIAYGSDADALPMEHEEEHRRLVDRLIEGGALKAGEVGTITVERESAGAQEPIAEEARGSERAAVKQGS
jgi:hypothetical protein